MHGHDEDNVREWDQRYAEERDGDPMWSGRANGTLVAEVGDLAPGTALDVGCTASTRPSTSCRATSSPISTTDGRSRSTRPDRVPDRCRPTRATSRTWSCVPAAWPGPTEADEGATLRVPITAASGVLL
jgi:hypothetical protein